MLSFLATSFALCLGGANVMACDQNHDGKNKTTCCGTTQCCQAHAQTTSADKTAAENDAAVLVVESDPVLRYWRGQAKGAQIELNTAREMHGDDSQAVTILRKRAADWQDKANQRRSELLQDWKQRNGAYVVYAQAAADGDKDKAKAKAKAQAKSADQGQQQDIPSVWIGVRMTPVPEPLASHIGKRGLMIGNVAKYSPANKAHLDRYDVILAFNGQKIDSLEDLMKAVGAAGTGKAEVIVIRGGKEQRITLAPEKRPDGGDVEYMYEDAEQQNVVDNAVNLRGRALRQGPDGQWRLEDLGQLKDLPQFKLFQDGNGLQWNLSPDDMKAFQLNPGQFKLDPNQFKVFMAPGGAHDDARVDVKVQVTDDGKTVVIHRDADGKINVTRTDPNGQTSTKTYDSAEELQQDDGDAAIIYRDFGAGRGQGQSWINVRPQLDKLPGLQKDWQQQIERHMKEIEKLRGQIQEQTEQIRKETQKEAQNQAGQARRQVRQQVEKRGRQDSADAGSQGQGENHSQSMMVQIDDDGGITVSTTKDGITTQQEFKNKTDLKTRAPELYKKIFSGSKE